MQTVEVTPPTAQLSVKVDMGIKSELQRMAKSRDRSLHYIMREALDDYVAKRKAEEAKQAFYQEAVESYQHYKETGLHVTHDEVCTWLNSLKTDNPLPIPQCHT